MDDNHLLVEYDDISSMKLIDVRYICYVDGKGTMPFVRVRK